MMKLGIELHPEDQKYVLAAYVHRRMSGLFKNDDEWLRTTGFHVKSNGRLDHRHHSCWSHWKP